MSYYKTDCIGLIQELAPSYEGVKNSRAKPRNLDILPQLQKDSVNH
jgi:hypothetical protein